MILVGSLALSWWCRLHDIPFDRKYDPDVDVWVNKGEEYGLEGCDVSEIPKEIMDMIPTHEGPFYHTATLDALYTIKLSHMGWDIQWDKHKSDVLFMRKIGAWLIPQLYDALVEYWKKEHGNKDYLSLYKSKEEFFNDHVEYVFDHDFLHDLVAHPYVPVYRLVLRDGHGVAIDQNKFEDLPYRLKLRMFREEISVIAAERWLINPRTSGKIHWMKAYNMALKKTVTSLTKNWATDFILQNLEYFVVPEYSYFDHLVKTMKFEGVKFMKNVSRDDLDKMYRELAEAAYLSNRTYFEKCYGELEDFLEYTDTWVNEQIMDEFYDCRNVPGFKFLEQHGGGEGGAEDCYSVFQYKDKYYKVFYSYYSYHGYSVDRYEVCEVKPVEKLITVYE